MEHVGRLNVVTGVPDAVLSSDPAYTWVSLVQCRTSRVAN